MMAFEDMSVWAVPAAWPCTNWPGRYRPRVSKRAGELYQAVTAEEVIKKPGDLWWEKKFQYAQSPIQNEKQLMDGTIAP